MRGHIIALSATQTHARAWTTFSTLLDCTFPSPSVARVRLRLRAVGLGSQRVVLCLELGGMVGHGRNLSAFSLSGLAQAAAQQEQQQKQQQQRRQRAWCLRLLIEVGLGTALVSLSDRCCGLRRWSSSSRRDLRVRSCASHDHPRTPSRERLQQCKAHPCVDVNDDDASLLVNAATELRDDGERRAVDDRARARAVRTWAPVACSSCGNEGCTWSGVSSTGTAPPQRA
jgi:hypothetical protein